MVLCDGRCWKGGREMREMCDVGEAVLYVRMVMMYWEEMYVEWLNGDVFEW